MDEKQTISFIQQNRLNKNIQGKVVTITPKVATVLLNMNWKENRPISDPKVNQYAHAIHHGHWHLNGEPMIMANNGVMIDGQTRCWAVLEADKPIDTMFVTGVEFEVKSTIDCGRARSLSFLSDIPPTRAAALNFLLRLNFGNNESTAANIIQMDKVFGEAIKPILAMHGSKRMKIFRQAPCTAAAALWYLNGDKEYVLKILKGLLTLDSTNLTPIAKSFLSQAAYQPHSSKSRATGQELFQRAFKALNPALGQVSRLSIKEGVSEIEQARAMIFQFMADAGVSLDLQLVTARKPAKKTSSKKTN